MEIITRVGLLQDLPPNPSTQILPSTRTIWRSLKSPNTNSKVSLKEDAKHEAAHNHRHTPFDQISRRNVCDSLLT